MLLFVTNCMIFFFIVDSPYVDFIINRTKIQIKTEDIFLFNLAPLKYLYPKMRVPQVQYIAIPGTILIHLKKLTKIDMEMCLFFEKIHRTDLMIGLYCISASDCTHRK